MLSKNKIKYLSSLSDKKARFEHMAFLVEGEKMVLEAINSNFKIHSVLFTENFHSSELKRNPGGNIEIIDITEAEASKISTQKTPQGVFAVVAIPANFYAETSFDTKNLLLALHEIQDPGNLGTIIRTADWFGIKHIICSKNTVDILNPKVLQSTMGAVFRVKLTYTDLQETIQSIREKSVPVFAAVLEGNNIYESSLPKNGILMMGNESKGLSKELIDLATHKLTIPRFGNLAQSSESLNVSIATAIILSEFCRRG